MKEDQDKSKQIPSCRQTTKVCPTCGNKDLVLLRSINKKYCNTCHTEIEWYLTEGQKPIK